MAPIVLTLVQAAFLLLLYLFVARAVRAIVRDLRPAPVGAPAPAAAPASGGRRRGGKRQERAKERAPRELVVHMPEARPRVLALDGRDVTFGRSETSTVILTDGYASERHARVFREGGTWYVDDAGSTNGTFRNQARVSGPTPLNAGDQLTIGKTVVEVRR
jgi:pSer/pThr/pTyr-binding forkhead associated (FHA) protein